MSVDFERGYAEDIEKLKDNAKKLLYHGVVGFNIEDGRADGTLDELPYTIEKIKALVEFKHKIGLDFIINARTCAYWLNVGNSEKMLEIALERGNAFKDGGADAVFVPGGLDEATVKKLVEGIDSPINIILNPVFHDFQKLELLFLVL